MVYFFVNVRCFVSSKIFPAGDHDSVEAVAVTPRGSSIVAGCNYGPGWGCLFPCHCAEDCDSTRGCIDGLYSIEGHVCESLSYQSLDDEDGRTFTGPQCQIGEFHQLLNTSVGVQRNKHRHLLICMCRILPV